MGFKIEYRDKHGRKVNSLEQAILPGIQDAVTERVRRARCPVHQRRPTSVSASKVGSELRWDAQVCCEELREAIRRALG